MHLLAVHQTAIKLTILISTMLHIQKPIPKSASWLPMYRLSSTKSLKAPISPTTSSIIRSGIITVNNSHCSSLTIIVLVPSLATELPRLPCSNLPQEPRANIPPSAMYLTDQSTTTSTQIFLPVPPTASSQTLLNTATLLPTSTLMPNPLIPPSPQTLGTDSTMNLIFGLSAFVMAGITIWQNRHYLRAIKMPWGKEDEED